MKFREEKGNRISFVVNMQPMKFHPRSLKAIYQVKSESIQLHNHVCHLGNIFHLHKSVKN